jgi:hypothetical protein
MQMAASPETGQDQISDLAGGRVSNQEISIAFQQRFGMRARDRSVIPNPTINFGVMQLTITDILDVSFITRTLCQLLAWPNGFGADLSHDLCS